MEQELVEALELLVALSPDEAALEPLVLPHPLPSHHVHVLEQLLDAVDTFHSEIRKLLQDKSLVSLFIGLLVVVCEP